MNFRYVTLAMLLVATQITWAFEPPQKGTRRTDTELFAQPLGRIDKSGMDSSVCNGVETFRFAIAAQPTSSKDCLQPSREVTNLSVSPSVTSPYQVFYVNFCTSVPVNYIGLEFVNKSLSIYNPNRVQLFYDYGPQAGCHRVGFTAEESDIGDLDVNVYGVAIDRWGSWKWTNIQTTRLRVSWW